MTIAKVIVPLLCVPLCACHSTPPVPPAPLSMASAVNAVVIAPPTLSVVAYFPPGASNWLGCFDITTNPPGNWQRLAVFAYPVAGAWMTNAIPAADLAAPCGWLRAGIILP